MNEKNSSVSVSKTYLNVQFDDNPWSCGLSRGRQFSCSNYIIDVSESCKSHIVTSEPIKGIVSQDFGGLQMFLMDRI